MEPYWETTPHFQHAAGRFKALRCRRYLGTWSRSSSASTQCCGAVAGAEAPPIAHEREPPLASGATGIGGRAAVTCGGCRGSKREKTRC